MIKWDLSPKTPSFQSFTNPLHSHAIFTIVPIGASAPIALIATISSDRNVSLIGNGCRYKYVQVVVWDTTTLKSVWTMSTCGGHIYALSFNPIDPNRMAVACGDNVIRIWNTAADSVNALFRGIHKRVTTVSRYTHGAYLMRYRYPGTPLQKIPWHSALKTAQWLCTTTYPRITKHPLLITRAG